VTKQVCEEVPDTECKQVCEDVYWCKECTTV
jgi:hypothetical protein